MERSCFGSCLVAYGKAISTDYSLIPSAQYLTLRLNIASHEVPCPPQGHPAAANGSHGWEVIPELLGGKHTAFIKVSSVATRFSSQIAPFWKAGDAWRAKKITWNEIGLEMN